MSNVTIKCNYIPRDVIHWWELTYTERAELDYVDTDDKREWWHGFRYRGEVYDLSEFELSPSDIARHGFDGWQTESAFSAVIVRYFDETGELIDGGDRVIVGYAHW